MWYHNGITVPKIKFRPFLLSLQVSDVLRWVCRTTLTWHIHLFMCASFIALHIADASCTGKIVVSKMKTDMLLYDTLQFSSCLENADRLAEYEDLTDGSLIHEILLQMYVIVVVIYLCTADIFNLMCQYWFTYGDCWYSLTWKSHILWKKLLSFCRDPEPMHHGVIPCLGSVSVRIRNMDIIIKNIKALYEVSVIIRIFIFNLFIDYFFIVFCSSLRLKCSA